MLAAFRTDSKGQSMGSSRIVHDYCGAIDSFGQINVENGAVRKHAKRPRREEVEIFEIMAESKVIQRTPDTQAKVCVYGVCQTENNNKKNQKPSQSKRTRGTDAVPHLW